MGRNINITGTKGKTYDLDTIQDNSRTNSENDLLIHVWNWNPNASDEAKRMPNPSDLKVGQIWLSSFDKDLK